MSRTWKIILITVSALVLVFIGCGIFLANKFGTVFESLPPNVRGERIAAKDLSFKLQEVKTGRIDSSLRERTLFLQFWEPGCEACTEVVDGITGLYKRYSDTTIGFYMVSSSPVSQKVLDSVILKHDLPFFVLKDSLPAIYQGRPTLKTYIITDSIVVFQEVGSDVWKNPEIIHYLDSVKKL